MGSIAKAIDPDHPDGRAPLLMAVPTTAPQEPAAFEFFGAALEARKLELLAAGGAGEIRRELEALAPPATALELFDRALEMRAR